MSNLLQRIRVLLHAAPTYLVAAAMIVTIVADEAAKVLPAGTATAVAAIAAKVLAYLAAVTAIVRRVTPVADDQVGLLPRS